MIPRVRIAHLPTLSRLSAALGDVRLWVKRDDQTGLGGGGNKTRKLEYVLAEAQANGARTLITVGAAQSNHCRQTAALAARFGLDCILVLSGDEPQPYSGNLLLDRLFGAEVVWSAYANRDATLRATFEIAWERGRRPFLIPLGASTPTGTLGYVTAFEEFAAQGLEADWIVIASSSAGTQAGLVLGARRVGWNGKILGVSIDQPADELQQRVAELASQAADRLDDAWRIAPEDILVNDEYLGAGYGVLSQAEVDTLRLFARREGLLLDPVYTVRAAAAMIDLIRRGFFKTGSRILFWHTGGTPALFADAYRDLLSQQ